MALNKVIYVDGETVITAENLNDIQDAIIALENAPAQGLTEDMKQALLQLARKVAYIDDQGQTYYQDLYDALYPPKTVVLITAVFEQGSTVIYDDTALDDLKQYLTVTAKYDDNTTAILADSAYTLSGLLEAGTSTVTVAYNGLTTTFTVNVTARPTLSSISAVYTQSGTVYDTDTLDSLKDDLVVTAHYSDSSTQTVPAVDYTLSGTLTAGTSTITVAYGGKTTTFSVTVTSVVLYRSANDVFTGTNPVTTNVDLLSTDKDFTIAMDINMTESLQSLGITNWSIIQCIYGSSPYDGFELKANNASPYPGNAQWMGSWLATSQFFTDFNQSFTGRVRFIITHTLGSGVVTIICKAGTASIKTQTISHAFTAKERRPVRYGGNGSSQPFAGTMTSIVIDGRVWDESLIDSFLS